MPSAALDRTTGGAAAMRGLPAGADAGRGHDQGLVVGPARPQHARPCHRAAPGVAGGAHRGDGHRPRDPLPTYGLGSAQQEDADLRRAIVRAFNTFYSESFRDHATLLTPVGIIPMHTPDEAIAELEFATSQLGPEGVHVRRPDRPAGAGARRAAPAGAVAGHARCGQRLRLRPGVGQVRGARRVTHVPHRVDGMADAQLAEQLRLQPHRHVRDRGRDVWRGRCSSAACRIASRPSASRSRKVASRGRRRCTRRSLGHWEKRNRDAIGHYDPSTLDRDAPRRACSSVRQRGVPRSARRSRRRAAAAQPPRRGPGDHRRVRGVGGRTAPRTSAISFTTQFHFGCEADDPMTELAFDTRAQPARRASPRDLRVRRRSLGRARRRETC